MANKIKCTCGHSWNKSDSSKKDATVCHVCGKNNMKDGGWLDKYDVPEAQNGIEGTMGGLTDIGFNYNGAWGGPSMAMGGSMPGAVGFTYARTQGIPSEGPYAKKTKASAQDGTDVKKPRTDMLTMDEYRVQKAKQSTVTKAEPKRSTASKALAIASNPMTALSYKVKGQDIPENFERGERNRLDYAMDIINPFSYIDQARQVKEDINRGNLLSAGVGALGLIPGEGAVGRSSGKFIHNKKGVSLKDLEGTINYHLGEGLGIKKGSENLTVKIRPEDLYPEIHVAETAPKFTIDLYNEGRLSGFIGLDKLRTGEYDIPGKKGTIYTKTADYPYQFSRRGEDALKGSGISGEFNKALTNALRDHELGRLYSSTRHTDEGLARWKNLVKKGKAIEVAPKRFKLLQNGGEMKFYQEGLDWKPRNISRDGSITKDDNGYWNPENWGEPVEIGSNEITMQGVYEPLLGISDTGDVQYMEPGQDYKFKGNKVTEYPIAQEGIKTSANPYFKSAKERDAYRQRLKEVSEQALSVGSDKDLLIGTSYHNIDEGNNCINGICGLNRRAGITYNKPTDVDRFLSGEKFAQAVAKGDEDYYQVDGNFQIGDHMMYRKKKGTASHNKIIYDSFVNDQGEKVYKVIDNAGGKQMKTDNYTESELKKMQLEGGGGYDKVNIYRPGYSIDKTLIEKERLERTSPEARKALADRAERIAWETSNNPGYKYSIRKDSEYYNDQPEGMQKFIEFANDDKKINKLVEKLGVDKGVIHDELLNTFGELGQENKWEDRTFGGTGGIENTIEKIFKPKSWSIGPGQIKFNTIDPELKQKFNIKKPKDLYDFDKIIPLMTAMNIKNRKYMENQGKDLSTKLIGKPGVGADELEGGVGRWTPYMYRGKLSNPVSIANEEIAGSDLYGQELTDKRNSIIRDKASLFDKGSYASNVFENIDKNLERTLPGEYFYLPQEMQPIKITAKKKKKNGGWLEKYK